MLDQWFIVSSDLARSRLRRLQQGITRAQGAFVSAQGRPVKRIDLAAEKIEIPPARIRAAPDKFDVGIGKRHHPRQGQIFAEGPLLDLIDRDFSPERAVAK